jgi:hypothetical protein
MNGSVYSVSVTMENVCCLAVVTGPYLTLNWPCLLFAAGICLPNRCRAVVIRHNMITRFAGLGTKNHCAGEDQQQYSSQPFPELLS